MAAAAWEPAATEAMFAPTLGIRTVTAALRDLDHEKPAVRVAAAQDLKHAASEHRPEAVAGLARALSDAHPWVRQAAAETLADLRATEVLDVMLEVAEYDTDDDVRQHAWMAIGAMGSAAALPALARALEDDAPPVRFQAVIAFARCAPRPQAQAALLAATHDEDALVCHIALRMAEELGDETLPVEAAMLERCGELSAHADGIVRIAAAIIRARAGRSDGAATLIAVARGELVTSQREDEAAAIELCGELGLREAIEPLRRRSRGGAFGLGGDPCAWQCRVALARLGDEASQRWILKELAAWNRDRRTLGVAAAGRARLAQARPQLEAMRGDPERADPDAVDAALRELDALA